MGLDTVEMVMLVEDTFGIQIPDYEAEKLATVQQLTDLTYQKILLKPEANKINKDELEQHILELLENITGIPKNEINMEDAFTNDLGMD